MTSSVEPVVQNVVSFAQIDNTSELNLKLIAARVEGSRYNRKRFPAVILRKTKPKSTILIFKSGKMIIIGSESETEAELAAKKSVKDIKKLLTDQKLSMKDFRVTNIVANADLGWGIDIGRISEDALGIKDDNFPGVVYKMGDPVKAVLLFSSGKVVFTGAKTRESIEKAYGQLKGLLEKYKVPRKELPTK